MKRRILPAVFVAALAVAQPLSAHSLRTDFNGDGYDDIFHRMPAVPAVESRTSAS